MRIVVLLLLIAYSVISCSTIDSDQEATVRIHVTDTVSKYASVTGKYAFWRFNDFCKVDENGQITFAKKIDEPELLYVKINKSYNSLLCYLEKGETIDINFSDHHYEISGSSVVARQNRLLQKIQEIRKRKSGWQMDSELSDSLTSAGPLYDVIEQTIDGFIQQNPDCSPDFIHYLRLDNRYYKTLGLLNMPRLVSKTYVPFSESQRNLLASSVIDSDDQLALLSGNYRTVLFAYLDQLRIEDPQHKLGKGNEVILNEVRLSQYLKSAGIKNYVTAKNILTLLPHIYSDPQTEPLIKEYCTEWTNLALLELQEMLTAQTKNELPLPRTLNISGIDKDEKCFQLSDYKGKLVLVCFWSVKSAISEYELFYIKQIRQLFPESKMEILGVAVDNLKYFSEWKQKMSGDQMVGYQIFCSEKDELIRQLGIGHLPHFCIVSATGELLHNNIPRPSSGMSHHLIKDLVGTR
jgi:hypothetical protein